MFRILSLLLVAFLTFATAKGDTIIVGVENESPMLNPLFDEDHDSALNLVFSGLVKFDENMNILPDLAKSWEISDDRQVYKFILRDDVKWHDGAKFSADDVIFSINLARDEELNTPIKPNFDAIKSIEKISDYEIKITLNTPFEPLLSALSSGIIPKHILENKNILTSEFNIAPIGTGAYKLKEWKKGQYMKFEANEMYYDKKPNTKNIYLKFIPDFSVVASELMSGSIDAALSSPSLLKSLQKSDKLSIIKFSSADFRALMFNMNNEIFKDKNLRISLNYATNKEAIVKNILHEYGEVGHNPIQRDKFGSKIDKIYEYNPKKAVEMIENLGYKKAKNGYFSKDGKELSFEIATFSTDPLRVAIANSISSDFQKIGINAKVIAKPSGAIDISKVDSFVIGWGSPLDADTHIYRIFHSLQDSDKNPSGWNYGHYSDKNVDEAMQKARTSVSDRGLHYAEFLEALHENPPYIFITYLDFPLVYNSKISGIKARNLGHHGGGFLWNVAEWSKN